MSALIRNYNIAQIPIKWYGRTWGSSNLRLREMGRRYLCTVLMFFFQWMLIKDDVVAEKLACNHDRFNNMGSLEERIDRLEAVLAEVNSEYGHQIQQETSHLKQTTSVHD